MTSTRHEWTAPEGEKFPYTLWDCDQPRAIIVAIHGLSGAALDFEPLAAFLLPRGIVTLAPELRGQGNDPKPQRRGDLAHLDDWFSDLRAFFAFVRQRWPGVPIYYYGESMGAALLTRFVTKADTIDQPVGLILASPVVVLSGKPSLLRRLLFNFFLLVRPTHRIDVAKFTKRDRDDPSKWVTRDADHRRWFETAPHRVTSFTVRFFNCLFELINGCLAAAPRLRVPVLVLYAAHDVFIPTARVEEFFTLIGSTEKELQLFPESYHLLLHDFDKAQALDRIGAWLLPKVGPADASAELRPEK